MADEGLGPDPLVTDPQSLAFWGRGIGGDWELSIPDHEFEAGLDLTGLIEVWGVRTWVSHAARRYSWMRPPSWSRRRTRSSVG